MRRPILSTFLLLGAVFGFSAGIGHVRSDAGQGCHPRREAFYERVADVCVRAARRADEGSDAPSRAHEPD